MPLGTIVSAIVSAIKLTVVRSRWNLQVSSRRSKVWAWNVDRMDTFLPVGCRRWRSPAAARDATETCGTGDLRDDIMTEVSCGDGTGVKEDYMYLMLTTS